MSKRLLRPEGFILAVALIVGLMAVMVFRPMPTDAATPTTHWYKDWGQGGIDWDNKSDVKELEDAIRWELYVGYADGKQIHSKIPGAYYGATLRLSNNITRGEFAVALGRCLDIGTDADFPMGRVNPLVDEGVITSDEADKDFNQPITRAEMAKWMGRAAQKNKADVKSPNVAFGDTTDSDILTAARTGVIKGYPDGNFHPNDNAMRAHAALMLVRFSRQLNSDLPEDGVLRELDENFLNALNKMSRVRYENGIWDNSILANYVSERPITSVQEKSEASGRDDMAPNELALDEFKVIEKHNNTAIFWHSGMVYPKDPRLSKNPFRSSSYELLYVKKVNGKWVITGGIATMERY